MAIYDTLLLNMNNPNLQAESIPPFAEHGSMKKTFAFRFLFLAQCRPLSVAILKTPKHPKLYH